MAVLKAPPRQPKTTVVQLRLDDEAMTKLAKYAEFFDCTPSYVVTEALNLRVMADGKKKAGVHKRHLRVQNCGKNLSKLLFANWQAQRRLCPKGRGKETR